MNEPGLEFVWVGDDAVDPLEQAQTLQHPGRRGHQDARGGAGGSGACAGGRAAPAAEAAGPLVAKRGAARAIEQAQSASRRARAVRDGGRSRRTVGSLARKPRPTPRPGREQRRGDVGCWAGRKPRRSNLRRSNLRPLLPSRRRHGRRRAHRPRRPNFRSKIWRMGNFRGSLRPGMPRKMPASDDAASEAQSYIRRLVV